MADRYLLESGAPDGYLLEDGTGVYLLDTFTPATLFPGTGAWYDPSDLTTLFQDSAGTVPVTADGDPVGKINDKSGNNYHLVQATSGNRPIYHTASGLSWIEFDGVNDALNPSVAMTYTTSMDVSVGIRNSNADTAWVTIYGGGGGFLGVAQSGSGSATNSAVGTPTDYVDGVVVSPATRDGFYTALGSTGRVYEARDADLATSLGNLTLGAYPSFEFSGRIYGLVITPSQSTGIRQNVRNYLSSKTVENIGVLSGTAALAFAPTGTLTGTGALTATSALTFSPTATIKGNAPIIGASTITFSPTGTILGTIAASGTSALTFSPAGTITGKGALTGTSSIVFSPSGTITGKGALTGTSPLTFVPASLIAGLAPITGTSPLSFVPSATLTGKGALSGTAPLTFSPAGTLGPAGSTGVLAGSSSLTFTPAGTIKGLIPATGSSSLTFAPSSTLTGKGSLTGTSPLVFAPAGTVSVAPSPIAGTTSLSFSAAGNVSAIAPLAGSTDLSFTLAGTLFGIVPPKPFVVRAGEQAEVSGASRSYSEGGRRGYRSSSSRGSRSGSGRSYSGSRGR